MGKKRKSHNCSHWYSVFNFEPFGEIRIEPDQTPTLNPLMIMIMIPLLDRVIFPLLRKRGVDFVSKFFT